MNLPHDRFCVLPWISLEASPIGTVRPCRNERWSDILPELKALK